MGLVEDLQAQQSAPWGSMTRNFGPQSSSGGGSTVMKTGGYGPLPTNAGPLAEAYQNLSNISEETPQTATGLLGYGQRAQGANAALARAQGLQSRETALGNIGVQSAQAKLALLQKLLDMFSGKGGTAGMPGVYTPTMPTAVSPDPALLAAIQAKVQNEFERPGGLQSKLAQLNASQNRYSADSGLAASRQASLDRARAGAMAEAYQPALAGTVSAMEPNLAFQSLLARTQITPSSLLALMQGV